MVCQIQDLCRKKYKKGLNWLFFGVLGSYEFLKGLKGKLEVGIFLASKNLYRQCAMTQQIRFLDNKWTNPEQTIYFWKVQ